MDVLAQKRAERAAYMREWNRSAAGRAYAAKRRKAHADYNRQWNLANLERRRAQNRASRERNREKVLEYQRNYHSEQAHKDRARAAVTRAITQGKLIRPAECTHCGTPCKAEGHHYRGYERENWLEVIWLCKFCHRAADANQ